MEEGAHAGATAVHDRSCLSCRVQRLIRRTICLCLTADRLFLQYAVCPAGIAQLVEHNLAKVGVASSSLVSRSRLLIDRHRRNGADRSHGLSGRVVMQRPAKPCTPVRFRPQPPFPASFTFPPRLSILPAGLDISPALHGRESGGCRDQHCPGGGIGRRSGLVRVPHAETRGCTGVKFGEPLTGRADGDPELSPCGAWESVETRRLLPKCRTAYGKGIVQTTKRVEDAW